jgi:hypothetical protein
LTTKLLEDWEFQLVYMCSLLINTQFMSKETKLQFFYNFLLKLGKSNKKKC